MLGLAGTLDPNTQAAVDSLVATGGPYGVGTENLVTLFKATDSGSWNDLSTALLAKGISGTEIDFARSQAAVTMGVSRTPAWLKLILAASAGVSAYHGYKRHENGKHPILWALGWGFLGSIAPVITPAVGFAQGISTPLPAGKA